MNIKSVLAKVAKGEELTEEEVAFVETYEEPDVEAVSNAKGKKERLKLEKKLAEAQALIDEKELEIEEASAGSSEVEKLQKQIEKLNGKFETAQAELEAERTGHQTTRRSNALAQVDVPWLSDVPGDYKSMVMEKAFADIDTEDLSDASVITPIVNSIVESQSRFINSGQSGGAGSGDGEKGKPLGSGKKWTREAIVQAQKDGTFAEHRAEIMAAASAGEIE